MNRFPSFVIFVVCIALTAFGSGPETASAADSDSVAAPEAEIKMVDGVKKKFVPGFGGVIAEKYEDSE